MNPPPGSIDNGAPEDAGGFARRCRELVQGGYHEEAVALCREGLEAHPTSVQGRLLHGMALAALGRREEALSELGAALEQEPHNLEALQHKAEVLVGLGRQDDAAQVLALALEMDPINPHIMQLQRSLEGQAAPDTAPVMSEPVEWDEDDEDEDLTSVIEDPPDLAAREAAEGALAGDEAREGEEDERYSTAPWLPPSYLERMRRGAAADREVGEDGYISDDETYSESAGPREIARGSLSPKPLEGADAGMVDDDDTVSLDEDYQEMVARARGGEAGPPLVTREPSDPGFEPVDDNETVSLAEEYQELVERAETVPEEGAAAGAVQGLPSPEEFMQRTRDGGGGEADEAALEEELEPELLEPGDASQDEDAPETGVGLDQELLLQSMGRAVSAGPSLQPHPDDDSSAALVDSSLLSEWDRAEAEDGQGFEEDPGEPTVAQVMPGFGMEGEEPAPEIIVPTGEVAWDGAEPIPDEEVEEATVALDALADDEVEEEEATVALDALDAEEVEEEEATVAVGPEPLGPLDAEEVEEEEATVAIGPEPLGPLEVEEEEATVAIGPEPLGPLDEPEWEDGPGEPTEANLAPLETNADVGWGDAMAAMDAAPDPDEDDDEEATVAIGPEPLGPLDKAPGQGAAAGPWGAGEPPRVPTESTKPIDLEPEGEVPLLSEVSLVPDEELADVEEDLEPLSTGELSEISVEMVLEEEQMPPLPDGQTGDALPGEAEVAGWGEEPSALPPYAAEEEGFGDPYGFEDELEEEDDYDEATQVRVDLPQLQAIISQEMAQGPSLGEPEPDDGLDAEFPSDEDAYPGERTDFYQEDGPAEQPYGGGYQEPYGEAAGDPYLSHDFVAEGTPQGIEGFPDEAAAAYDASLAAGGQAGHEQTPAMEPAESMPAARTNIPAERGGVPDWSEPRVERTEDLHASATEGGRMEQVAPAAEPVHDARASWPKEVQDARQPGPPTADLRAVGGARRDGKAAPKTSLMTIIRGRPGGKRLPLLIAGTVAVILLAFGIGRVVRHMRLGEQIEEKRSRAARQLMAGNILDYMAAAQSYAEILKHRPEDEGARWARARIQAAIPMEFGDPNPQASQQGGEQGAASEDKLATDTYVALFAGSLKRANTILADGRNALASSAVLAYLEGRVRLLEGKPAVALPLMEQAVKAAPGDVLFQRWRAEALAESGKSRESLDAFAGALKLNPNHVGSAIGQARLLLETRGDLGQARKDLESVLTGARSAMASRGQRGWASALLARILLHGGDLTRARAYLTRARSNQPTRDALFLDQLALAYLESFQMGEAEGVIQESKDLLPERPHPHFLLARVYTLQGRHARALASLRKARGLTSPAATLLRARILFNLGRQAEAMAEVGTILEDSGGDLQANLLQAEILASQGKGAEAEQGLLALLPSYRRSVELLTTLGEVYLKLGRTHQARQRLGEALRINRQDFRARMKLAEVYMAEGQYSEAHKRLSEAARSNQANTVAMRKLAELEHSMGNLEQARGLFASLVKRSGNDPDVHLGSARVLAALHDAAGADKAVRAAESRQADRQRAAQVKGEIALLQGKAQVAISHLMSAAGGQKPGADALHLLVHAYLMNNDEASAKEVVQRLSSFHAGSPEALAAAGSVELSAGNFSRAWRNLNQALQVLRTSPRPPLVRARILVQAGRALQDDGQAATALAKYEEASRVCPRCPQPHYRIGLVHDEGERYTEAIASLRRAKSLDPKMKEVYYDLGAALEHAGRNGEAASAYKTYLSLNPPAELAEAAKEAIEALGQ